MFYSATKTITTLVTVYSGVSVPSRVAQQPHNTACPFKILLS